MRRRPGIGIAAAVLVAVCLAGCTPSIEVVPSSRGYQLFVPGVESADTGLRNDFESTPQQTHDFWSDPGSADGAEGIDTDPGGASGPGAGDPANGTVIPATETMPDTPTGYGDVSDATRYDRSGLGAGTFGRLYFTFDGVELFVCSATVVNSDSADIIVTAAHCVMRLDGSQRIASNMLFVPGDRNNMEEAPFGAWAAISVSVPTAFAENARSEGDGTVSLAGWNYDFAFVKLEEHDGQSIQEVTGGQGIAFGYDPAALTQLGYPSAPPYDGTDQYYCASTSFQTNAQGGYSHPCSMTQGSSGGAWLADYDVPSGTGLVLGVTSTGGDGVANCTVLGQTAYDLYRDIDGATP